MQFLFTCYFIKKLQKGYFWIHYIQNPVKNKHLGQNVEPYLYIKLCHWRTFTSCHFDTNVIVFTFVKYPTCFQKLVFQNNRWSKNTINKSCMSIKVYIKTVLSFCACNWLNLSVTSQIYFLSNILTLKKKGLYKQYRVLKVTSLLCMCMQTDDT